jgi:hypothetical protein
MDGRDINLGISTLVDFTYDHVEEVGTPVKARPKIHTGPDGTFGSRQFVTLDAIE